MKCSLCGTEFTAGVYSSLIGQTALCPNKRCPNWGHTLAVPQMGSPAYKEVTVAQADPNWKPLFGFMKEEG